MDMSQVFSGDYLRAADLQGKPIEMTIRSIEIVEFDDGKKPIIGFHGTEKKLVANKTNTTTIIDILGRDSEDWIGGKITLIPAQTDYAGKQVACIRVALPEVQVQPVSEPAADLPF